MPAPAAQSLGIPVEPDEQEEEDMEVDLPEYEHLPDLVSESESDKEPKIPKSDKEP